MKSYYIDSVDAKLHVLATDAKDEKETILFVHGYPGTSSNWEPQFEFFKEKYRIAAFDLRGIKNSFQNTIPKSFKLENLMDDLDHVIEFLVGQNGKIHLVGHDWGAIIGWSFISKPINLKRIFTLTAISCPHPRLFYDNIFGKLLSNDFLEMQKSFDQLQKSWYIFFFQLPIIPEFILSNLGEPIWKALLKKIGIPESDEMYNFAKAKILESALGNVNLYRDILKNSGANIPELPTEKIDLPIKVIIPENDFAISTIVYEKTKDYFPNADLEYLQANHWVHREKPFQVNQIIDRFLRDFMKNSDIYFHSEWDTENLSSGEILIQLKKRIASMNPGNILKIKTKESGLKDALFSWSLLTGNQLLKSKESEFFIRRKQK